MQDLEQEIDDDAKSESTQLPLNWPSKGHIQFQNVSLRYSKATSLVLKNIDFNIMAKSKVGIVGRTGAGKSSLITALLRLTELDEGNILIDDLDISKVSLANLRSAIAVIPQDPILFQGNPEILPRNSGLHIKYFIRLY